MDFIKLEIQQKIFENWLGNYHSERNRWIIGNTVNTGRGLFATRDTEVNELILSEPPLIIGPVGNEKDELLCVACLKLISKSDTCSRCGLPVCSANCPKIVSHFEECSFLGKFNSNQNSERPLNYMRVLTPIRGLFLSSDEKDVLRLLQANRTKSDEKLIDDTLEGIHGYCSKLRDELVSIASALDTNAFQIVSKSANNAEITRGLYPVASLINHSCTPNSRYSTDENYVTSVCARRPIKRGEEISISYSKLLWGTPARQRFLKVTKNFSCRCDRCLDPTESSTFLSAMKCFDRSCSGLVLPVDPINFTSSWKCFMCHRLSDYKKILGFQDIVSCMVNGFDDRKSIKAIDAVINDRLLKVVPSSNQFIVELKIKMISSLAQDRSMDDYKLIERYCLDMLSLLNKLDAGECTLKGVIEYKLFKCRQHIVDDTAKYSMAEFEASQRALLMNAWSILKDNISSPIDLSEEVKKYFLCEISL